MFQWEVFVSGHSSGSLGVTDLVTDLSCYCGSFVQGSLPLFL